MLITRKRLIKELHAMQEQLTEITRAIDARGIVGNLPPGISETRFGNELHDIRRKLEHMECDLHN